MIRASTSNFKGQEHVKDERRVGLLVNNEVIKTLKVDKNNRIVVKIADLPTFLAGGVPFKPDEDLTSKDLFLVLKRWFDLCDERGFFEENPQMSEYFQYSKRYWFWRISTNSYSGWFDRGKKWLIVKILKCLL